MNQEKLFFKTACFFMFLLSVQPNKLTGQKNLQTESGQEITIQKDGTWKYADKLASGESGQASPALNLGDAEIAPDSIIPGSQAHQRLIQELTRIEQRLLYNEAETASQLSVIKSNKALLKEEIKLLKKGESEDLNIDKIEMDEEYETLEQRQKILEMRYVIINNMLKECSKLKNKESELNLDEIRLLQIQSNAVDFSNTSFNSELKMKANAPKLDPMQDFQFEIAETDSNLNPPSPECNLRFEGLDEVSNTYRKEVELAHFFSYTHPKMKSYFKQGDFLQCEAFVSIYGGYKLLNLQVSISSTNAKKAYGSLDKGAFFVIWLLNGEKIFAINVAPDEGKLEPYTGNTIYRARYTIQDSELKELSKYEVDKVGILWSSGFEEYEVYNVDFFIHQLACLNKK